MKSIIKGCNHIIQAIDEGKEINQVKSIRACLISIVRIAEHLDENKRPEDMNREELKNRLSSILGGNLFGGLGKN